MSDIEFSAEPGDTIHTAAKRAIEKATEMGEPISLRFNHGFVRVFPQSYYVDIVRIFALKYNCIS